MLLQQWCVKPLNLRRVWFEGNRQQRASSSAVDHKSQSGSWRTTPVVENCSAPTRDDANSVQQRPQPTRRLVQEHEQCRSSVKYLFLTFLPLTVPLATLPLQRCPGGPGRMTLPLQRCPQLSWRSGLDDIAAAEVSWRSGLDRTGRRDDKCICVVSNESEYNGRLLLARIFFISLAIATSRRVCGGAMLRKTGSNGSAVGSNVPEIVRTVECQWTSTSFVWVERHTTECSVFRGGVAEVQRSWPKSS